MTIVEAWRILRRNALIITVAVTLGVWSLIAIGVMTPPSYQASARLFVSAQSTGSSSELLQGSSFAQQRVKSYADVVKSPMILDPVVKDLDLSVNATQLAERVSAKVPLNTVLIDIAVTDKDAARSADIANAVADSLVRAIGELEATDSSKPSPVRASKVQPAMVPTSPVSPSYVKNGVIGFAGGLLIGLAIAFVREHFDTSIRTGERVRQLTSAPVLGGIAEDKILTEQPLIAYFSPHAPLSEAYRQIRTNLQFVDLSERPSVFMTTSSIPGEGKTTTTVNLAMTHAQSGLRVCLVDADLRRPRVASYLGLEGAAGLTTVLIGEAELSDVLQQWGNSSLFVLPAGATPPNPSELLGSQAMADLITRLRESFDVILIDAPPLLPVADASILASVVGGAVVVVGIGAVKTFQLERAAEQLESVGAKLHGVILNRMPDKGPDSYHRYGYGYGYATSNAAGLSTTTATSTLPAAPSNGAKKSVPEAPPNGREITPAGNRPPINDDLTGGPRRPGLASPRRPLPADDVKDRPRTPRRIRN